MKRLDSTIDDRNFDGRNDGRGTRRRSARKRRRRSSNSYLGVGRSLGSDRDRQRLQDRNAAERSRVERMLAEGPLPTLPTQPTQPMQTPARWADAHPAGSPASAGSASRPSRPRLRALPRAQGWGCPVCASRKVVSDEVTERGSMGGTLRLSECLHCDHRWTEPTRGRWSELGRRMSGGGRRSRETDGASRSEVGFVRPATAAH